MVRANMLDNIDYFLRLQRNNGRPFGGVQMVFFGDLFQLPPVVSSEVERHLFQTTYESPYFFSFRVMQEVSLETIELQKVYRQENRHFLSLLEAIRLNRMDYDDLEALNMRHNPEEEELANAITLSARNASVDTINRRELDAIPMPARTYAAKVTGSFPQHLFPTDAALELKLNAQVMFLRNDPDKRFVNGTIGKVVKLEDDAVTVLVETGGKPEYIKTERQEWEILKYKVDEQDADKISTDTLGTFKQFPLRLAWALTIHKSQGKTFDKVVIDLGRGAFEHGQTYVALSRCRTLEGIVLKQALRPRDVIMDERVVTFYEQQR
jgi:ATP-dependent exoDNAse (exonuclease V) alpha subunit